MTEKDDRLAHRITIKQLHMVSAIALTVTALAVFGFVVVLLTRPQIPEPLTGAQLPAGRHRIDLVLIDTPMIPALDVELMLQPLLMVADMRMPGQSQHFRVLVNAKGFPWPYAGSGIGAAAYVAEEDIFLVDAQAVGSGWPELSRYQRWAFVMAHEATHLWQRRRGTLLRGVSKLYDRSAYRRDPIEIEAYREGVAVANAFPGMGFTYSFGGEQIAPPDPNPYAPMLLMDVQSRAEIHIRTQTTPLGMWREFLHPPRRPQGGLPP